MMQSHEIVKQLIKQTGLSQRNATRILGISERNMRAYVTDPKSNSEYPVKPYIFLALECIVLKLGIIERAITDSAVSQYLQASPNQLFSVLVDSQTVITDEIPPATVVSIKTCQVIAIHDASLAQFKAAFIAKLQGNYIESLKLISAELLNQRNIAYVKRIEKRMSDDNGDDK